MNHRSMKTFWYALYQGTVQDYDDYGHQCGTYTTYYNPVKTSGIISPAKGSVIASQFGDDDQYDRVITLPDSQTPIDEYAVLWVEVTPELDATGALKVDADGEIVTPWDYIVRRVARGLDVPGSANIAVSKVSVSSGTVSGGVSA